MTERGIELIAKFEGLRLEPYICPGGKATIGYGNTTYPDGTPVKITDPFITKEQAVEMLRISVAKFEARVRKMFPGLNDDQIDGLTSLAYNIGASRLDRSTLAKRIREGATPREIYDAWMLFTVATYKGRKRKLEGLEKRRRAEIRRFFSQDVLAPKNPYPYPRS